MIVTITIPDELYQKYSGFNPTNPRQAIQKQLERFKDVETSERVITLSGDARKAVEAIRGLPIDSGEELAKWIQDLVALKIGGSEIPLLDGQRKRMETEAKFYKKTPEEYIIERVRRAINESLGAY